MRLFASFLVQRRGSGTKPLALVPVTDAYIGTLEEGYENMSRWTHYSPVAQRFRLPVCHTLALTHGYWPRDVQRAMREWAGAALWAQLDRQAGTVPLVALDLDACPHLGALNPEDGVDLRLDGNGDTIDLYAYDGLAGHAGPLETNALNVRDYLLQALYLARTPEDAERHLLRLVRHHGLERAVTALEDGITPEGSQRTRDVAALINLERVLPTLLAAESAFRPRLLALAGRQNPPTRSP